MNDDAKLLAIKLVEAERDEWQAKAIQHSFDLGVAKREADALRASLRDMTEYAEDLQARMEKAWDGYYRQELAQLKADIAKARGLLG